MGCASKVHVSALPKVTLRRPDRRRSPELEDEDLCERPTLQRRSLAAILGARKQAVDRRSGSSVSPCHFFPPHFPFFFLERDLDLPFALGLPFSPDGLRDLRCAKGQFFPFLHVPKG